MGGSHRVGQKRVGEGGVETIYLFEKAFNNGGGGVGVEIEKT
jgi:hypothetical protein